VAKGLTPKQERFKNNLLKGMDKGKAYEKAGYVARGNVASVNASNLLKNPKFNHFYQAALQKIANRAEATKERVLKEECRIAYADLNDIFNGETLLSPQEIPEDIRRAISSVKVKQKSILGEGGEGSVVETTYEYRFWDKGKSLERISKHLGLYEKDNAQKAPTIIIQPESVNKPDNSGVSGEQ
jgi:phage terminase small subunit